MLLGLVRLHVFMQRQLRHRLEDRYLCICKVVVLERLQSHR